MRSSWAVSAVALIGGVCAAAACGGDNDNGGGSATDGTDAGATAGGGNGGVAADAGGTSGDGATPTQVPAGEPDRQAICDGRCQLTAACGFQYTYDECMEVCVSAIIPSVVGCEAQFYEFEACRLEHLEQCIPRDQVPEEEVCPLEAEALASCVRGSDTCWETRWYVVNPFNINGVYGEQWACRCKASGGGALPGEPCSSMNNRDCAAVCCSCPDSTVTYSGAMCSGGVCASEEEVCNSWAAQDDACSPG